MPEAPRDFAEVVPRGTRGALPLIGVAALIGLLVRLRWIPLRRRRSPAMLMARSVVAMGLAEPVTDEDLAAVWAAARDRALEGDVEAAAVVIEVARRQRST